MLSYRHAFHAGNHADVLKHIVLSLVIDYLKQKEKPFWYIDTHAGTGAYALDSLEAKKNTEYESGIARLLERRSALPEFTQSYFSVVDAINADELNGEGLKSYPGSPAFAAQLLREQDRLRLFEMHPQDSEILRSNFQRERRTVVAASDGFVGLKALLPPPSRRALVLIDPPYELKEDYARVVSVLEDALRRFATGTYMVWYPLLPRAEAARLPQQLAALAAPSLRIELRVNEPQGEFGMYGSGMFVINPPWLLRDQMKLLLPLLREIMGAPGRSDFVLEATGS
ncbi:MAG: competence protein ComJ [Verrucomicrobiaceae bacterium]|nr:competence protein ComJ [Verrucomicrobiaceae bacterium]